MLLARNTGRGFIDVSAQAGTVFNQAWVARGMAIGDLDNDGRPDAVVTTNEGPAYVLHNEARNSNHWILLKLVGHRSNRDGIDAEVAIVTSAGSQYATVSTASHGSIVLRFAESAGMHKAAWVSPIYSVAQ
jgi:enediyne biosynthesis protein E4